MIATPVHSAAVPRSSGAADDTPQLSPVVPVHNESPGVLAARDEGADRVSGWKVARQDPASRVFASRVFNGLSRFASGIALHDLNCGLKAYRREVTAEVPLYGELHRFIPLLAHWR